MWMSEFKPDTPHRIRVDVDIKYMRFQPNKVFVWTWRCSAARGVGVLPYKACTGMCRWTGGFDLSVLKRVYNFVWACYKGISCTIDLISYMNFVYKSNVCRRRAFSSFVLNRVRVSNPQRLTYTQILVKSPSPPSESSAADVWNSSQFLDVRLLFFTYPAEKIVARVDRSKAEMLSADTLLRNWRILTSWSGRWVVIISDTDNFSDINDNREF